MGQQVVFGPRKHDEEIGRPCLLTELPLLEKAISPVQEDLGLELLAGEAKCVEIRRGQRAVDVV